MKASVVIANFNNAKYIQDCINSINSQTYNNIEIIFFDDNSKDNSIEIIKKFKNVKIIRNKIGPVAAFKVAIVIKRLPKTRSGKILRGTIRKIADNVEYKMPPTIDDPAILDEIKEDLIKNKILKSA